MHTFKTVPNTRVRWLKQTPLTQGPIVYWMSRDQRAHDNWALSAAHELATSLHTELHVVFCLTSFLNAPLRHYDFMLRGLSEVEQHLAALNIPLLVLPGEPAVTLPNYLAQVSAGALVMDFSPLTLPRTWKTEVVSKSTCPVVEVDAHNIVPCWLASPKQEYAARTFRPKIHAKLGEFLTNFPELTPLPTQKKHPKNDWKKLKNSLSVLSTVSPVSWIQPGSTAAQETLSTFLLNSSNYETERNDPTKSALSNLSPYLHFGQIAAQRVALETQHLPVFFEEVVVRRELAENFCYYNPQYNSLAGFPEWAQKTLAKHRTDLREYLYTLEELETAQTHDVAWNAAQTEMVQTGKMHGYMRMYWAKKILEWSPSPAEALVAATTLNDTYELDGRDPNGYTGIAWAIGGVHDRPWFERPIFGTVRYMNEAGLRRKYRIAEYIEKWLPQQNS